LLEAIQAQYDGVELLARHERTDPLRSRGTLRAELVEELTERQFEVWLNHSQGGESFEDTWKRLAQEKGSVTKLSEIVSRPTVYDWNEEVGVDL
jgi:hypothetical protein